MRLTERITAFISSKHYRKHQKFIHGQSIVDSTRISAFDAQEPIPERLRLPRTTDFWKRQRWQLKFRREQRGQCRSHDSKSKRDQYLIEGQKEEKRWWFEFWRWKWGRWGRFRLRGESSEQCEPIPNGWSSWRAEGSRPGKPQEPDKQSYSAVWGPHVRS